RGRGPLLNLSLFTQMIPPIALIIPMYVIFKALDMMNTRGTLVIIYLSLVLPYLIWIMKSYIDGIPLELEEAAMIDGCSKLRSFFTVVVPVIITGLAATVIFAFIITWNEFFYAFSLTKTLAAKTLPVLVYDFNSKFGSDYVMSATAGVLASLPPVLVALVFQKYIIKGLAAGAVKG
ncbi:MAG: carbohydrate ABC transporter permease, partial [Clostridiales bacterium]|nr:carbohydrate ABC transporter permease [Clostridiales bacterium]